jgi:hypothetical protein
MLGFYGRLQRGNRVQFPVLVRWRFRLKAGEVLKVGLLAEKPAKK